MNKFILSLLVILISISSNYYSQCNFVLINSTTDNFTINGTSLTPCLNQASFTVNMENVSPFSLSNMEVTIDLPDGINYISGSSTNATETNITDLNEPVFSLTDIGASTTNSNTLSFTIEIDATCALQTFLDAGGIVQNIVTITNDATNNGSTINCNIVHTSQVYSASVPNLSITNISEQSHVGNVGESFQRCISIINGGSGGLSQFSLNDVHGAGIGVNAVSTGTVTTNGLTEEILLSGADFSAIGNGDNIFDPGETIIICETVEILSCVGTASTYRYSWGCNNENCQELTDGANVTFPGEIPDLKMQRYNNFRSSHGSWNNGPITNDTECFSEDGVYTSGITFTNVGTGTAYNVLAQIDGRHSSSSSGFDVSNIRMTRNGVSVPFHRDSLINPTRYGSSWASCLPANSVGNIDFNLDSVAPGETVYIEWDWYTCFQHKNCTNRQHMFLWYYKANYENKCAQNYEILRNGGSYWIYFNHTFSLDNSPGTMIGNSTSTVSYVNNSWYNWIPRNTANDQFRFQIVMPSCLGFDETSFKITRTDGVVHSPNSSTRVGDTINIFYTDLPVPNGGSFNESTIDYDITLDCSTCSSGSYPIEMTSYYTPNVLANCDNELQMGCNTFNVSLVCPDPCPGINFNQHYAKRINFGLPDNDNNGLPDPAGVLDFTQIRTDRMIFGDTLQILYGGNVNNSLNDSIWPYVYATTQVTAGGHLFSYLDAEFTLYQVATGTYHRATGIPAPAEVLAGTTKDYTFSLDINSITFVPALPANYSLQDQDSVFLKSNFKVAKNVGDGIVVVNTDSRFYCSDIAVNPPVTNQFGCPNLIKNFTVLGFHLDMHGTDTRGTKSCDLVTLSQNYYLYIAGTYGAKNKFRNEYRPFVHPENLKVTLPDAYTYESARFNFVRTTGVNSRSSTSGNTGTGSVGGWYPLTPSSVVGNQYIFNTDVYFGDDPINDSILFGDEGYYGTFQIVVSPNCTVEGDTSKRVNYEWEYETVPQWYGTTNTSTTHTSNSNYYWDDTIIAARQDWLSYDKPKILLQSNLISQNIPSNTAEWNVSITNNSNTSDAANSWFGIPTIGTVVADSLFDIANGIMVYPSTTGIFQMGDINGAQTLNYTIYTHINGCNSDSIVVHHGWDCVGYPVDVSSYPCNALKTTLFMTPLMPELSNYINATGGDTIGLCDTAHFEIKVIDFQLGNAFNLTTSINVPSGMIVEPGSCYIKYPESGVYVSIPNPINTSGNNWEWDVSALEATINANGLQGVLDQTLNKYYIKFNCLTDCDFVSGSRVTSLTTGEAKCGRVFNSNVGVSSQIFIGDALPPYAASIRINTTYITPCLGNTPVELVVVNNGPLAFGVNDSVYFRLDNGINYDANSFTGILNAPTNGTPSIVNNNGVDELAWKLPAGVGVGDTTKFSFTINGDPSNLECGVLQLASQITTYGGAVCSTTGSFCNIDIATADTLKNIFIYKGYLDVSNSVASYATPNAPSGEIGNISFDIFNSGETISTGTETIIQYYQDTDNDGVFSGGDTYITNDTIQDQLTGNTSYGYTGTINIPGGLSCRLIAVIDTSLNPCTCTPSQILINLPLVSPATSHIMCSEDVIQIGNAPINTYTYSWNPAVSLDNGLIAQPNYSTIVNYPATSTFELVRTIDRGACFANDTVSVLVYSKPVSLAGIDIDLCNTYSTVLAGNQPLGTATGLWSEDATYTQPSVVTFADATLFNSGISNLQEGTYRLIWTVTNGTCNPVTDTVEVNVYDQPTSNANIDQDLCNIYTTVLAGNQPLGTATGMWTMDASHVQPSVVTFATATSFNSNISNLQEGTYQLVWTVSNGTCTPATDTVVINVYDQPLANASVDQDLCNIYVATLDGNQPPGTATGMWTMDANYTQPSSVTFADATLFNSGISNLQEGTYQLIWTISNGICTPHSDTMLVNVYDQPTADASVNQDLCNTYTTILAGNQPLGTATGLWTVDGSHVQPSVVTFADATLFNTGISNLQEGIYQLVWTVSNGTCTPATDTVVINVFDQTIANANVDQDLCNIYTTDLVGNTPVGTATGIWIMDPNHVQPSVVTFADATLFNTNISNLQEGTYQLLWILSNGSCTPSVDTMLVNVYDQPTSNANIDQDLCNTYTADLAGNQPLGTATGLWTMDASHTQPSVVTFTDATLFNTNISNLQEGIYQLVWTVSNGTCTPATDTMIINVYDQPTSDANIDQNLCNIYTTDLAGNQPLGTATGLWTMDVSHTQPSVVTFVDATLFNTNISDLQEGTYQLVWTVSNGTCTPATDTIVVNVYDQPTSDANIDQDLCNVYTTDLDGNQPLGTATGLWTMDASHVQPSVVTFVDATLFNTNISNLQEGTYHLVWTVSNGTCTPASDTMVINVYDQPTSNADIDQDLCNIYTTDLAGNQPLGTATGLWTMDASHTQPSVVTFVDATLFNTNITNLEEGIYQLVWTVSNGTCTPATDTMIINVYNQPTSNANLDQDLCNIYTTDLASNQPLGTAMGMWTMDASHMQPSVVTFADATLSNTNISNLQEGTYQLVWTVSNGTCTPATDTMVINVYDQPTSNANVDQEWCAVYTTDLDGNQPLGTATGLWTMDGSHVQPSVVTFADATLFNTNISNLQEGTYQLIWTVSNGTCTPASDVVTVKIYDQPVANAGVDQALCEEFTTVLEGNQPQGTASGLWTINNGFGNPTQILFYDDIDYNATASNFQEGSYQLIWTLSNGNCPVSMDTVELTNYKLPTANFNVGNRVCLEECVEANNMSYVQSPYSIVGYRWLINGVEQEQTVGFEGLFCLPDTGMYNLSLIVETNEGCIDTSDVQNTITVMSLPVADFSYNPDEAITELLAIQFTDESIDASTVTYSFGDGMETDTLNPIYWYTIAGTYDVTQIVLNQEGCVDTIVKEIEVIEAENVFIPNSFTPNGDGKNDVFYPVNRSIDAKDFNLYVFNRWGQLIYESHNPADGWNGLHHSKEIKTGAYVWKLSYYSNESQQVIEKIGHVNVLE